MLPNITTNDLRNVLDDIFRTDGELDLDDLRDARRAATVLSPDDCKAALLAALQARAIEIAAQYD